MEFSLEIYVKIEGGQPDSATIFGILVNRSYAKRRLIG